MRSRMPDCEVHVSALLPLVEVKASEASLNTLEKSGVQLATSGGFAW